MGSTEDALFALLTAGLVAWATVPVAEWFARRVGAIDEPGPRSLHCSAVPRVSGRAILAGIEVSGWIWLPTTEPWTVILLGAVAVALVGALDDVFELSALVKFTGQVVAASIPVVFASVYPEVVTIPFLGGIELGWTAWPLTVIGIDALIVAEDSCGSVHSTK